MIKKYIQLNQNNKIIVKNTAGAFIVKGLALIISLLTTPAFIKYFNNNAILGVWYTLLSVLVWFLSFDLGIGNGIRNNLVNAFAANDRKSAKKIISSGFFSVTVVSLVLAIIGSLLISLVDLNWLFNISSEIISSKVLLWSALFVFLAIMLRFLLTTVSSIFYALQKSAINNLLALAVSVFQLLFVLIFRFETAEKALVTLSLAYIFLSNLPLIVAGVVLFLTKLRDCAPSFKEIDKKHIKMVMSIGSIFFICQILYMVVVNTNEFFVTKLFSPEFTTEYTFYYKITSIVSMLVALAMTPIWSVVTKALAEKNYVWLQKLYKKLKLIGYGAIAIQFALIPFLQIIMNIWLRENTITVNYLTALAFACFGGVFVYSTILSTIVCGLARMKLQAIVYGIGVLFKLLFVILIAQVTSSWVIVVWSNVFVLLPYCIVQQIDLDIYFKKLIVTQTEEEKIEEGESNESIQK